MVKIQGSAMVEAKAPMTTVKGDGMMTLKGGLGSPLTPDRLADEDTDALAAIILHGIPGKPMPPWHGLLNESEALWIARALQKGQIR